MKILIGIGLGLCSLLPVQATLAKPIAWADGWTFMAEWSGNSLREAQVFYAPKYWYSLGAGALEVDGQDNRYERRMQYARLNVLPKRWNLPAAQANLFAWGGLGRATGTDFRGSELSSHVGFQADYETRRVYASIKAEHHDANRFAMHSQTLQLGWAPYAHDYDVLATWFVVQVRDASDHVNDDVETSLLLRLFKRGSWIDIGANQDGQLEVMLMFNY